MHALSWYRGKPSFRAEVGRNGGSANKTGRQGKDLVLPVPPGTIVRSEAGEILADLTEPGEEVLVARGGRGGRGNARFATSRRQTPRLAERGEPGDERQLHLELRLLADVGIIGAPNAGKSTLLSALTHARPKIADYPFTTLHPNLGVADTSDGRVVVLADIPGLIEGAHQGAGLGDAFLRHIRRTRVLIHLLDGLSPDPIGDMDRVNGELAAYDSDLASLPQVVVINKLDDAGAQRLWPEWKKHLEARAIHPMAVSAREGTGLDAVLRAAVSEVDRAAQEPRAGYMPVHRPPPDPDVFGVAREPDGAWRISGKTVERAAAMTYWEHDEAVRRFQRSLARMGIEDALRQAGVRPGDNVRIGDYELEWED
jgi:GTP-binding protein